MQNTLKKWIGGALGAVCLALTPVTFTLGGKDHTKAEFTEAQCIECCDEPQSICLIGSEVNEDQYDPGTESCPNES